MSARATYTFLDSEILAVDGANGQAPAPFVPGDRLLRRPRHQGSADVTWNLGRLQAFAVAEFRGETLDVVSKLAAMLRQSQRAGAAVLEDTLH